MKKEKEKFYLEGKHIIKEAIERQLIDTLLITDEKYCTDTKIKKILVSKKTINKFSTNKTNIGIIGIGNKINIKEDYSKYRKIIILDSINDPINLGTIIRNAAAFEFDAIFKLNNSVDKYNDKVIKTSQGMSLWFPIFDIKDNLNEFNEWEKYFFILEDDSKNLNELKKIGTKIALVFGNETHGISRNLMNDQNIKIKIDIHEKVNSLNLANSAAIAMYAINKIYKN